MKTLKYQPWLNIPASTKLLGTLISVKTFHSQLALPLPLPWIMEELWTAVVAYSCLWNGPIGNQQWFPLPSSSCQKGQRNRSICTINLENLPARTQPRRQLLPCRSRVRALPLFPSSPLFPNKGSAGLNVAQHVCVSLRWPASRHKMLQTEPQEEKKKPPPVYWRARTEPSCESLCGGRLRSTCG